MAEDNKMKRCPVTLQPDIEELLDWNNYSADDFDSASQTEKKDFIQERQSVSYWKDAWRRLKKNVVAMVALGVIIFLVLFAFVGPYLVPYGYDQFNKGAENLHPTHYTLEDTQKLDAELAARTSAGGTKSAEEMIAEAEAEAARAAAAAEEARKQRIIANTISGTDITYNPTMSVSDDDIWLMACIIDWEAGYQPYAGKLAVANVILNRVRSGHYPSTVTGVIYQRSQFSGVSAGAGNPSERFAQRLANGPRNTECMQAALEALSGVNNIGGYTSFRALYTVDVNNYSDFVIIGDHIFH